MTTEDLQVGQLVLSKAGRDRGKSYLVYAILNHTFVSLVDGKLRTFAKPKRKNVKHLQVTGKVAAEIREKLLSKAKVSDEQVYQAIQELVEEE